MRWVILAVCLSGCIRDELVSCGDLACAPGMVCTMAGACATPANVAACIGLDDGDLCMSSDVADGNCRAGACGAIACGNGVVDRGEACDDGNVASGDGCSNDCLSEESCGNRVIDLAANEQCDDGNDLAGDGCTSRCAFEVGLWREISPTPPTARVGGGLSIDASGRLLLFNGATASFLAPPSESEMWSWNGTSWIERVSPVQLPPRARFAYSYDSSRKRLVVFGGIDASGAAVAETWEWDGVSWQQRLPTTSPAATTWSAMAYDPVRQRTILFGGLRPPNDPSAETWEWDGTAWLLRQPTTSPPARSAAAMGFDPSLGKLVLTGGQDMMSTQFTDTWEWDGTTWASKSPLTLTNANLASMVWDPGSSRLVLVNGSGAVATRTGDVWTTTSTPVGTIASAPAVAYDPARGAVIAFGGFRGGFYASNEAYVWNGVDAWSALVPFIAPSRLQAATYDALRGRVVAMYQSQLFEHDGSSWISIAATGGPTGNGVAHLAYVESGGYTLATTLVPDGMGGFDLQTWSWDGAAWTLLATGGPPGNSNYAITYDSARDSVVMVAGRFTATDTTPNETWEWDGAAWAQVTAAGGPIARTGHLIAYDAGRRRTVLYGGATDPNEVWEYDGSTWTRIIAVSAPPLRTRHALAYDALRGRIVMFGGTVSGPTGRADLWDWDGVTWTERTPILVPTPRVDGVLTRDRTNGLLLACGTMNNTVLGDTWRLRYESALVPVESCMSATDDTDGDGHAGCEDSDCWVRCTPLCPPGTSCSPSASRCGDGACGEIEDYVLCPGDCPAP